MRSLSLILLVIFGTSVAGCATKTQQVQALPESVDARTLDFQNVSVAYGRSFDPKWDKDTLTQELTNRFNKRADRFEKKYAGNTPRTPVDAIIEVDVANRGSVAASILIGDTSDLNGSVVFVDPATKEEIAVYYVRASNEQGMFNPLAGEDDLARIFVRTFFGEFAAYHADIESEEK